MAVEMKPVIAFSFAQDSYQLSLELEKAWKNSVKFGTPIYVIDALKSYEKARRLRVAAIHGTARMATLIASPYKAYLARNLREVHPVADTQTMRELSDDLLGVPVTIPLPQISKVHAQISYKDGAFFVTDLGSKHGTWITNNAGRQYRTTPNFLARIHPLDIIEFGSDKRVGVPSVVKSVS
ncbi:hypothetical protein NL676_014364 [Syzygium grande]|nr:hypothetical protein NL676_014364 [Syzygium grande]